VRELIGFLINPPRVDGDFLGALRRTVEGFSQKSGVQADLEVDESLPFAALDPAVGVQLLRVTQEALTNVRKHACARHARVRLSPVPGGVELLIEDDGVGFDQHALPGEGEGFGMRIMHERVAEIGGVLNISSRPGQGARVSVQVPVGSPQAN
jgi:signal transduction histidine kinase